ncbi:MAG: hypothetical protein RLZ44_587 [Pseudomonadota bacterium]
MSEPRQRVGLLQVVASVLASFFGVQKSETRERDFQHGRARDFILVGLLLTALFIFLLWAVVRLVMYLATGSQ